MTDVTILGGGDEARICRDVLSRAGFSVQQAFELDPRDTTPVIVGEVSGALQVAREAVEAGRHVLMAATHMLTPERLASLLTMRRRSQALFVWNPRRYHPGFRFVGSLKETDAGWRPRYVRHERLTTDAPSQASARWRALNALALVNALCDGEPEKVSATAMMNTKRNAPELLSLKVSYAEVQAAIVVGLGEGIERHETLLAAPTRKVFVDGMSGSAPVRIVDDEAMFEPAATRWLSCPSPSAHELARQECIAFLEATGQPLAAKHEAALWLRSLAAIESMDRSLSLDGVAIPVAVQAQEPRVRVLMAVRPSPVPAA
jgi:hypothetical protein